MNLLFAWRYFRAKKSTNAINIIAWVSMSAIVVGAASLILVLSVFNGFEDLVKSLYTSVYPDIKVGPVAAKTMILTPEIRQRLLAVARHPGAPSPARLVQRPRDIGVVVARNDGNVVRRAQHFQPQPRHFDFPVERQVDEVAGDRDVIGLRRLHVADDRVEDGITHMTPTMALPVDVAGNSL